MAGAVERIYPVRFRSALVVGLRFAEPWEGIGPCARVFCCPLGGGWRGGCPFESGIILGSLMRWASAIRCGGPKPSPYGLL